MIKSAKVFEPPTTIHFVVGGSNKLSYEKCRIVKIRWDLEDNIRVLKIFGRKTCNEKELVIEIYMQPFVISVFSEEGKEFKEENDWNEEEPDWRDFFEK